MNILYGVFIVLHGLVHFWYVTLSQGWVEFQADMGWTGKSWLLSGVVAKNTLGWLATALYSVAAVALIVSGGALLTGADWARTALLRSAAISSLVIVLFWDGSAELIVQKGLLGLLINLGIIGAILMTS